MIRLSIIIPAIGDQAAIDATLVSVLENRPSNCEVILACQESYVDPYDLDDEIGFVRCPERSEFSYLLNRGIWSCQSEYVHWLSPGAAATEGWTESPVNQLMSHKLDFVSPLTFPKFNTSRISTAGVRYGRGGSKKTIGRNVRNPSRKLMRLKVDAPSMMAGFGLRKSILRLGGFSARCGAELADADLAARINAANMKCVINASCRVIVESSPYEPTRGFTRGRHAERLYWRHAQSNGRATLLNHSAIVLFDTIKLLPRPASLTSLVGRLVGAIDALRPVTEDNGVDTDSESKIEIATRNAA